MLLEIHTDTTDDSLSIHGLCFVAMVKLKEYCCGASTQRDISKDRMLF